MKISIGDHVSFISEKLEGKVTGIIDNGHVNVYCDEYGFEIPAPIDDLIVLDSVHNGDAAGTPAPKTISTERSGRVSIVLVPSDYNRLQDSTFDLHIVNDTDKTAIYTLAASGGKSFSGLSTGNIDPESHVGIGTYTAKDIEEKFKCIKLQVLFYTKRDEDWFTPVSCDIRINSASLFKSGAYRQIRFFKTPVYSRYTDDMENVRLPQYAEAEVEENPIQNNNREVIRELNRKIQNDSKSATSSKTAQKAVDKDVIEVDLHAGSLLETTAGMDNGAILEYQVEIFKKTMEKYKLRRGQKIVFIHGKGEGVLRQRIIWLLQTAYKRHSHQDASFKQYGFGATLVTIR